MSASLITRVMLNLRDVRSSGMSRQHTTDEPFSYDTPDATEAQPLSTFVLDANSMPYSHQARGSQRITSSEYVYDEENGEYFLSMMFVQVC